MMLVVWFQAPLQLRLNIFFNLIPSFLTFLEPMENSEDQITNIKLQLFFFVFIFVLLQRIKSGLIMKDRFILKSWQCPWLIKNI